MAQKGNSWGDYAVNLLIHGLFRLVLLMPYRVRVPMVG